MPLLPLLIACRASHEVRQPTVKAHSTWPHGRCQHGLAPQTYHSVEAYTSKLTGAFRWSKTSITASLTSGPIPSPGIIVTVWGLASPGEGTYVILVLVCKPQQTHSMQVIPSAPPSTPFRDLARARPALSCAMLAMEYPEAFYTVRDMNALSFIARLSTCWACSNGLQSPRTFLAWRSILLRVLPGLWSCWGLASWLLRWKAARPSH